MRILAFDTSGPRLSAACVAGTRLLAHRAEELGRGHGERLLPALEEVLGGAGWSWDGIDLVAVTVGPGNFTGLRAGIAVARALALSLGCRVVGIGTLGAIAESFVAEPDQTVLVAMDARREEAYVQRFAASRAPLGDPAALPWSEAERLVDEGTVLAGDGAARLRERTGRGVSTGWALDARYLALAAHRHIAEGGAAMAGRDVHPLYLRAADARLGAGASLLVPAG